MANQDNIKVVVDSRIDQKIPTVVVAEPPQSGLKENLQPPENFFVRLFKKSTDLFMDFLETIVVALSIFVVVYLFLVQPHEVKGISMEPTLHNNEYILTDKISYKLREVKRGDIVIFKSPKNPEQDYIKRIIGLPSERVKIQNGSVFVDGKKIDEPYLRDLTFLYPGSFMQEGLEIDIPTGKYFVLGDNRPRSSDSREFGPIQKDIIIGKAFFRYWPITELGLIPEYGY